MSFEIAQDTQTASWEKITRKMVDPITFSCSVNITFVPRIEDCSYETTCLAHAHPRIVTPYDMDRPDVPLSSETTPHQGNMTRKSIQPLSPSPSDNRGARRYFDQKREVVNALKGRGWSKSTSDLAVGGNHNNTTRRGSAPFRSEPPSNSSSGVPSLFAASMSGTSGIRNNKKSSLKMASAGPPNSGSTKPSSLGAFFRMTSDLEEKGDIDNHSISSRSLSSRSIADRSHAERSKAEQKLAEKAKQHRGEDHPGATHVQRGGKCKRRGSKESIAMQSIDETSIADFSTDRSSRQDSKATANKTGTLSNFLNKETPDEIEVQPDAISVMSGSTLGSRSISQLSNAERSKSEKIRLMDKKKPGGESKLSMFLEGKNEDEEEDAMFEAKTTEVDARDDGSLKLEQIEPVEKRLRFKDGHDFVEIPALTASMYDDLFYASDELADFRYEAFLEEAGLDINEYM